MYQNFAAGNDDNCCFPVICKDGTVIEAKLDYKAHVHGRVDLGNGQPCTPYNVTEPKCTEKDRMFT